MNYTELASNEKILKTIETLGVRGVEAIIVETKEQALEKIKSLIPAGASVNNGSSTTLKEIGFVDYLKAGNHGWNNLHEAVLNEKDSAKQAELRNLSNFADYYLGSVHAMSQTGEMVIASASGSQLPSLTGTARNIVLVVGMQKITETLDGALKRLREYVVPLENERMKSTGAPGTVLAKILIMEQEPAFMGRKIKVIFVNEKLGF